MTTSPHEQVRTIKKNDLTKIRSAIKLKDHNMKVKIKNVFSLMSFGNEDWSVALLFIIYALLCEIT